MRKEKRHERVPLEAVPWHFQLLNAGSQYQAASKELAKSLIKRRRHRPISEIGQVEEEPSFEGEWRLRNGCICKLCAFIKADASKTCVAYAWFYVNDAKICLNVCFTFFVK